MTTWLNFLSQQNGLHTDTGGVDGARRPGVRSSRRAVEAWSRPGWE